MRRLRRWLVIFDASSLVVFFCFGLLLWYGSYVVIRPRRLFVCVGGASSLRPILWCASLVMCLGASVGLPFILFRGWPYSSSLVVVVWCSSCWCSSSLVLVVLCGYYSLVSSIFALGWYSSSGVSHSWLVLLLWLLLLVLFGSLRLWLVL